MANARTRVGPEWTSAITNLTLIVTIAAITAALYWAQAVLIPIALAVVMTFVLSPAVSRLQRWGVGRTAAVALVMAFALANAITVGAVVAQQLTKLGETLPDHGPNILAKIQSAKQWLLGSEKSRLSILVEDATEIVSPGSKTQPSAASDVTIMGLPVPMPVSEATQSQPVVVQQESTSWWGPARTVLGPVGEFLGTLAFAGILTIFMLLRREDLRNRMIRLIGNGHVTMTTKAVDDAATRISRYLLAQLGLNIVFGMIITVGLAVIGLPYPVLWGFLAFLMRYVPYVGTWIGVIPPALFSLALSEGWAEPAAIVALFVGLEVICNNFFEPRLYGSRLGISDVALLIAAAFWAFLWGPIGLILSGPLTVCLLVLGKYSRRLEFLDVLLGDEPALEPRVAFYQRLAARDQDEAYIIAMERAKEIGAERVFDEVMVPALALAKRDHQAGLLPDHNWDHAMTSAREVAEEIEDLERSKTGEKDEVDADTQRIPLLLVPARDEADHAALELFTRRLDRSRWDARLLPVGTLASELVEVVREAEPSVVVIGALPPGGLAHTRYLVSRIRAAVPDVKVLVGRWGSSEDLGEEQDTRGIEGVDWWSDSLATSVRQLQEWSPILRESAEASPGEGRKRTPRKGTPALAAQV